MNKVDENFIKQGIYLDDIKQEYFIVKNLCDKAKELIFMYNRNIDSTCSFLDYFYFNDDILKLSPIEQILEIAFMIYDFYIGSVNGIFTERKLQKEIYVNNKKYIADFYLDFIVKDMDICKLKKPLIIECDGFEYHANKKQVNYDYERETNLKLQGYDIIRFTGTQIYNEPLECVEKICNYLQNAELGD